MPRLVLMTWVRSQRRWTRMYKGVRYYVSTRELGTPPTEADSLAAANAWWRDKQAEVDGRPARPEPGTPAAQLALLEAWAGQLLPTGQEQLAALADLMDYYKDRPLPDAVAEAVLGRAEVARLEEGVKALLDGPQAPPGRAVGELVDAWVETEKRRVSGGKLGPSRADMNRICLCHFRDWIGPATPVEQINEVKWLEFYNHLAGQVAKGVWGHTHVDRILGVARRFVRFLWELRLIDLPRNLDSKRLTFASAPRDIEVFGAQELARLYAVVANQSRLHFLLMLNCGMTARDINDLRHDQIDWGEGVVTRKRSKTRAAGGVPVVRYKLWPQTFALLKKHRSNHPEVVLLTSTGRRWIEDRQGDPGYTRSDKVASALRFWMKKAKVQHAPKALRATAASKLGEHPRYKFYAQYFLGQSPRTVADKHYVKPNDVEFFAALAWLEGALGLRPGGRGGARAGRKDG
jgi:integrase